MIKEHHGSSFLEKPDDLNRKIISTKYYAHTDGLGDAETTKL